MGLLAVSCGAAPAGKPTRTADPERPSQGNTPPPSPTASSTAASSAPGGWSPLQSPTAAPRKSSTDKLTSCVEAMRSGDEMPGGADAATYADAFADEQEGRLDQARKGYLQIISQFPGSPYVPLAYLAFAELFAVEGEKDPSRREFAYQAFEKVIEYPPERNPSHSYALLRASEVRRASDPAEALDLGRKAILSSSMPLQRCGPLIRERALAQVIDAYASVGSGAKAVNFFRPLVVDENELVVHIDRLANRYGKGSEACRAVSALPAPLRQPLMDRHCSPR